MEPGTTLFRIHKVRRKPWWFSSTGDGRFDLTLKTGAPRDAGTCYFGREPAGCFVEVFRRTLVSQEEVDARWIAACPLPSEVSLADCTSTRSRVFGITAEIHSGSDYALTQAWAAAFFRAGFDGIQYLLRHNPAQSSVGIALFGPAGSPTGYPDPVSERIGQELLRSVARRFGVHVQPAL